MLHLENADVRSARVLVCCCINWGLISFLSPDYDDDDDDDEFGDKDGDDKNDD